MTKASVNGELGLGLTYWKTARTEMTEKASKKASRKDSKSGGIWRK